MSISLIRGQKIDITNSDSDINLLKIAFEWNSINHIDIDISAFLLNADGKIVSLEDFVFYGQPVSSHGSVLLEEPTSSTSKQSFSIHLPEIQNKVEKIVFTLTIYESEKNGHTFSEVNDIELVILNKKSQEEIANFLIDYTFSMETAIVLGSLYRYSGEWKFHAVGSGFYGGLADLCEQYGVEVDNEEKEPPIAGTENEENDIPISNIENEEKALPSTIENLPRKQNLLELLLGLRASSRHSVVSEGGSDEFQEKLYIETELDEYLEKALQQVGEKKWDLIVLGGNAGDGKSALIQKVYAKLPENLKEKITVNWDATHSDDPDENQLDILGTFFSPFLNEKNGTKPDKTHLIAMNTGMIVSFFEQAKEMKSEGLEFDLLQEELYYYLDLVDKKVDTGWRILLINLDQRNLLAFDQNEQSSMFRRMMEKLNIHNENGFLFEAFQEYEKDHHPLDPIFFNLKAISHPKVQDQIERSIYKTIITHDLHFTPRAAWDLLYHLITADDIHISGFKDSDFKKIGEKLFFQHMFSYSGDHDILKLMYHSDPCLLSTQILDSHVIQLSLQPQADHFDQISFNTEILKSIRDTVGEKGGLSAMDYALFAKRRAYFFNEDDEIESSFNEKEQLFLNYEKMIQEYISYGMIKQFDLDIEFDPEQLQIMIESLRTAIVITFGESNKKDLFQVQELKNSGRFRVLTKLELPDENQMEPNIALKNQDPEYYRVIHFAPREVVIAFMEQNGEILGELAVDFGLFELLEHIRKGYNPSSVDLNRYHHFKFFCNQLFTKLAESSTLNSVSIHDRIQDVYMSVKPPQGLLKKKFEVEKA